MNGKALFLILLPVLLLGCVSGGQYAGPMGEPFEDISFIDSSLFDNKLSRAMKARTATIEVRPVAGFTTNDIPKRLDKWFYMVDRKGGEVKARPLPGKVGAKDKGILGEVLIEILIRTYENAKKAVLYAPAGNYHATVFYRPGSGTVEKVVFSHKRLGAATESERARHPSTRKPGRVPLGDYIGDEEAPRQPQKERPGKRRPHSNEGYISDM